MRPYPAGTERTREAPAEATVESRSRYRRPPSVWKIRGWLSRRSYWTLAAAGLALPLAFWAALTAIGSVNRVFVDDVDERYATFRARGLDTTLRPESPIHTAPVDQTWGLREFAVTDPDGNGLCFCMPIK